MAFNPFIELDENEISKLGFEYTTHPYIYYSDEYGTHYGTLYSVKKDVYKKIRQLFNGDNNNTVGKKDKVFICPGCKLPQFRIKEYLKKIGATLTRDIEKATIIISTDDMCETVDNGYRENKQARISKIFFEDRGMFCFRPFDHKIDENYDNEYEYCEHHISEMNLSESRIYDKGSIENILFSSKTIDHTPWTCILKRRNELLDEDYEYFLYPIAMKLIYEILSKKVPVLFEDELCAVANSGLKLNDPEVFESIKMMLNGTIEDRELAKQMIFNSDFRNCEHEIYWLSQNVSGLNYSSTRDKNRDYFCSESNFHMFSHMSDLTFIEYMHENDKLDTKIFQQYISGFIEECLEDLGRNKFHNLFDFKIKWKNEWLEYSLDENEKENEYLLDKNKNDE